MEEKLFADQQQEVKKDEFKLDAVSAERELARIEDEFVEAEEGAKELLIYLIRKGELYLSDQREICIVLKKPIQQEQGKKVTELRFSELNFDQFEQVQGAVEIDYQISGKAQKPIKLSAAMTLKTLRRLLFVKCGLSDGEINRIGKRDIESLTAIQSFLV